MSWLFSQALVEEYSEAICLDGEQSVQSSGNNIQQAYCAPDKMTGFSRLSRFGITYKPLMENRGEELLTLYREGFHAKTSQPLGKERGLTENDQECGQKWQGSFVKYNRDLCLWKTHQFSLLGDLDEFLETWPQWGLMRDGECWEQITLERHINETEYGLLENKWATPTTMDSLPPKSIKALMREATITRPNRSKPTNLRDQVSNMQNWPTPTTRDYKGKSGIGRQERKGNPKDTLPNAVGGNLNPTWTEWLMGWPLEWTDLKPLEMDKSHFVPQQLGEF